MNKYNIIPFSHRSERRLSLTLTYNVLFIIVPCFIKVYANSTMYHLIC